MGDSIDLDIFKKKLMNYIDTDIKFTRHAELQALARDIDLREVKKNILNPEKLIYVEEQSFSKDNEEKYNCYFVYSKSLYHRYVLTINGKIIIVTIIKINRDWQKAIG